MKITIPESLEDITIKQYQEFIVLCDSNPKEYKLVNGLLKIFCGINNAEDVSEKDRGSIVGLINKALRNGGLFSDKPFMYKGEPYGMIPNFDKITGIEHKNIDLFGKLEESKYKISNIKADSLHLFAAVVFRKVKKGKKFNKYKIVGYEETIEEADNMLSLPMSKIIGIESFFLTIYQDLEIHIQKSTQKEQEKEERL